MIDQLITQWGMLDTHQQTVIVIVSILLVLCWICGPVFKDDSLTSVNDDRRDPR